MIESVIRVCKAIASSRLCSRRMADKLLEAGKVTLAPSSNAKAPVHQHQVLKDHLVPLQDLRRMYVDGKPLAPALKAAHDLRDNVFLCYKKRKELVTYNDPAGRSTLFDRLKTMGLPDNLIPVGRLDYMSEGLMILTTDGNFARQLELPENAFARKYKARIYRGIYDEKRAKRLLKGIHVKESRTGPYKPILIKKTHETRKSRKRTRDGTQQEDFTKNEDASVGRIWLEVTVTEGKYREVRQALAGVGLHVDRLIRIGFGPFNLKSVKKGDVIKVVKPERFLKNKTG